MHVWTICLSDCTFSEQERTASVLIGMSWTGHKDLAQTSTATFCLLWFEFLMLVIFILQVAFILFTFTFKLVASFYKHLELIFVDWSNPCTGFERTAENLSCVESVTLPCLWFCISAVMISVSQRLFCDIWVLSCWGDVVDRELISHYEGRYSHPVMLHRYCGSWINHGAADDFNAENVWME